jgi:hypothetical protein
MNEPRELDLDEVCRLLKEEGIPAYVEQTGGGCATIYAGLLREVEVPTVAWYPASGAEGPDVEVVDGKIRVEMLGADGPAVEQRWEACAGPGYFAGPGWTNGRGWVNDFYVGLDDDGESKAIAADDTWTEQTAATEIAKVVRSGREQ